MTGLDMGGPLYTPPPVAYFHHKAGPVTGPAKNGYLKPGNTSQTFGQGKPLALPGSLPPVASCVYFL